VDIVNKNSWRHQMINKKRMDIKSKEDELIKLNNELLQLENDCRQLRQKMQQAKHDIYFLDRQISLDKKDLKSLENEVQNG
jgi:septum formation inhibitor MinC